MIALSVNLNKIALIRNSRDTRNPDVPAHARMCIDAGADARVEPDLDLSDLAPDLVRLFPQSVEALGEIAANTTTECWWSPYHPFKSSLTGETTAELIKKEIGSAFPGQEVLEISVKGRNLSEGVPRSFTLNSNEILEALQEPLQGIVGAVKEALEQTPPELGADVAERGIVLTGGGAMLRDIDKLLMEETGLPVVIADDPLTCVARGGGRVIELIDEHGPAVFGLE